MSTSKHFYAMGNEPLVLINLGTAANPTIVAMDHATEPMFDNGKGEFTFKPRGIDFELMRGAKKTLTVSLKYSFPTSDAVDPVADALYDSFINGTPVELIWSDRPLVDAGARGVRAWCEVFKFPMPAKAEEGVVIDVEAKPTDYCEDGNLIAPGYLNA